MPGSIETLPFVIPTLSWSDIASPTPAAEPSQGKQQIPHDSTVRNDNLWVFDVKPG